MRDIIVISLLVMFGILVAAGGLAVIFGIIPSPGVDVLIRIKGGRIRVQRGVLRSQVRDDVAEVVSRAGVSNGFISLDGGNHVQFSRTIPPELHQRLRNVLLI
jgi:hypothetical protein